MIKVTKVNLFLILLFSLLPVLGIAKISGSSEAREAHVAQVVLTSGEWILPDRNGYVPSKPVLYHWLIAVASMLTGQVNEFTARLPAAVLGLVIILILFSFSRKYTEKYGANQQESTELALLSVLVLLSSYGFFSMMLLSMVDMGFACFCFAAICSAIRPLSEEPRQGADGFQIKKREWFLFFGFAGLATLTKGPLGLVLPCIFLFCFYCVMAGWRTAMRNCFKPKIAWILYLIISLPWYFLAYFKSKQAFVERQLLFENVDRFFGGQNMNQEVLWFYIPSFISRMAPWSVLLLIMLTWLVMQLRIDPKFFSRQQAKTVLALVAGILAVFIFFSVSSGKRHSYLLPLFPLLAFTFVCLFFLIKKNFRPAGMGFWAKIIAADLCKFCFMLAAGIAALICLLLFGILLSAGHFNISNPAVSLALNWISGHGYSLSLAPCLALLLFASARFISKDRNHLYLSSIFLFAASLSSLLTAIYGVKAEFRDYSLVAAQINLLAEGRDLVAVRNKYDELLDPVFFYLGKPVAVLEPALLAEKICQKANQAFISRRTNIIAAGLGSIVREEAIFKDKVGNPGSIESRAISLFSCKI